MREVLKLRFPEEPLSGGRDLRSYLSRMILVCEMYPLYIVWLAAVCYSSGLSLYSWVHIEFWKVMFLYRKRKLFAELKENINSYTSSIAKAKEVIEEKKKYLIGAIKTAKELKFSHSLRSCCDLAQVLIFFHCETIYF